MINAPVFLQVVLGIPLIVRIGCHQVCSFQPTFREVVPILQHEQSLPLWLFPVIVALVLKEPSFDQGASCHLQNGLTIVPSVSPAQFLRRKATCEHAVPIIQQPPFRKEPFLLLLHPLCRHGDSHWLRPAGLKLRLPRPSSQGGEVSAVLLLSLLLLKFLPSPLYLQTQPVPEQDLAEFTLLKSPAALCPLGGSRTVELPALSADSPATPTLAPQEA